MSSGKRSLGGRCRLAAGIALACALAVIHGQPQGFSFFFLDPAYAQHVFGVTNAFLRTPPEKSYLGGVVVLQDGDVIAAECETNGTRLHRFEASATYEANDTILHPESFMNTAGGCGIALHPDGFIYSNMNDGVNGLAKIDPSTGASTQIGSPPGNALGIAVDPRTNHLVYAGATCKPGFVFPASSTCTLFDFDPVKATTKALATLPASQVGYVDGIAFEPRGDYIFLTNRFPAWTLVVLRRDGNVVQRVPMTAEPVGLGFHAASPKFVVTNNQNGTMTRFDFPGDNYAAPPTTSVFAAGGFRGDLMQAGPDGCLYVTQDGARYDSGDEDPDQRTNSIVRICDGFAPPPGVTPDPPPAPSSLCGFSYNDADNNGVKDHEPGIAGVTITLSGLDELGRTVGATATTPADGSYCFNNLRAGTYTLAETQPPGYLDGKDTQGTPGTGTTGNDTFSGIVLAAGVDGRNNNFGELLASSLSGYVYLDADNNGVKAGTEAGIAGVAVTLTGTDDLGGALTLTMSSGADGAYTFAGLRPGTYTITEAQPPAYADGKDTQGTPGNGIAANDVFSGIVLAQNVDGRDNNFGEMVPAPRIALVKKTNGTDNNLPPGPFVPVGSSVTWTYVVSNLGNVPLSAVGVTDDKLGAIVCPDVTLAVAAIMTCTASAPALAGQNTNLGTVTARDGLGTVVTAADPDNYFGASPAVSLVKQTNGSDNDAPPGLAVATGSMVTWTYVVRNTGNVSLTNVTVSDDKAGAVACPATTLAPGASVTCAKTGTAVAGQNTNIGTVTANDPTGATVGASNPDNYFGVSAAMTLVKKTNGSDNDSGTGPLVAVGSTVTWTYVLANTGNVALSNVALTDDKAGAVGCPAATLAVGASMTCTKAGTAVAGQYVNVGTATAKDDALGKTVTASNPDRYFGARPAIALVKKTNGSDNDTGTGPSIAVGSTVTWTYIVSNTGNVAVSSLAVTDDKLGVISCPSTSLAAGASLTCTTTGTAIAGQYVNVGTVTAKDASGTAVTASNPDRYFGVQAAVSIVKKTNGTDNDTGTGPKVAVGSTVTWTYTVTNTGNVSLSSVAVTDDKAGPVACPSATLAAGARMTCTKTGKAVAGQYTNTGTVTGKTATGATVSAKNVDHYYGMVADTTPPVCTIQTSKGPPYRATLTFSDSGTGIAQFNIIEAANMTVSMPSFTVPSPGPLKIVGTEIDSTRSSWLTVEAIDFAGNSMWCDPVATTVTKLKQDGGNQTFTGMPEAEHIVTVENDSPGIRRLDVIVNGVTFAVKRLDDNEVQVIDIAPALRPGWNNTITLVPRGRKGETAFVVIADH